MRGENTAESQETPEEKEWDGRGAASRLLTVLQASWPCFRPVAWLHLLEGLAGLSFPAPCSRDVHSSPPQLRLPAALPGECSPSL